MIRGLLYRLTEGLPCRLIPREEGVPYLERYYVGRLLGVTFYLHRFVSSDEEPYLHNHPWSWGRALVLAGSYDEEYVTDLCPRAMIRCGMASKRKHWGFLQHGYAVGPHDCVMFVPYPGRSSDWWKEAPKGKDVGREPLK